MVVFNYKQAGIPNIGNQLPEFGSAIPIGDSGYSLGEDSDTGARCECMRM